MSKNFELMKRAGKLLEIELPSSAGAAAPPAGTSLTPAYAPSLGSAAITPALAPARAKKWRARSGAVGVDTGEFVREESRRLIHQVFLATPHEPPHVVVFAGMDHGVGCSCICANAAEALSENVHGSVCLVEANLRSPSLHELYGTTNQHGFTDALAEEGPARSFAKPVRRDNFFFMSCGSLTARSRGLANSERLRNRFRDLRSEFDFVLVDAPPVTRYSDAIALGRMADGFVLVLEANATRREAALRISEHLRAAHIQILGAVLNKRTFPIPESLYRHL